MVFNIKLCLLVTSEQDKVKSFLVECIALDTVNAALVGGVVLSCLALLGESYHNVKAFITYGARYKKSLLS